jgi:hypothetical protein
MITWTASAMVKVNHAKDGDWTCLTIGVCRLERARIAQRIPLSSPLIFPVGCRSCGLSIVVVLNINRSRASGLLFDPEF